MLELKEGLLTIVLNRPEQMNALNLKTLEALKATFEQVHADPAIKGVILMGAGDKAFAVGADVKEFSQLSAANGARFAQNGQEVFATIERTTKPVVAAIHGYALGGGCELAMACHIRIATEAAKFGQPEVNLGLIPGYGGTQRLPQLIGKSRALEFMMSGEMINADQALKWGFINYIVPTNAQLQPKAAEILMKMTSKAPLAVGRVMTCVHAAFDPAQDGYAIEAESFGQCCGEADFKEGVAAFLGKRKPNFTGQK